MSRSLRDLYGLCVNTCTDSEITGMWMNQNQTTRDKSRDILSVIFRNGCERGYSDSLMYHLKTNQMYNQHY